MLVKLDEDTAIRLSGTMLTVESGTSLTIAADTGDHCVDADGVDVFLVSRVDGHKVSEKIEFGDLMTDQSVDVFGSEGTDGCFDARTILADGGG